MSDEAQTPENPHRGKRVVMYRERKGGEGEWSGWSQATLGVTSLLVKAQDRPDEYEVSELMPVTEHVEDMEVLRAKLRPELPEEERLRPAIEAVLAWKFPHGMVEQDIIAGYEALVRQHLTEAYPHLPGGQAEEALRFILADIQRLPGEKPGQRFCKAENGCLADVIERRALKGLGKPNPEEAR